MYNSILKKFIYFIEILMVIIQKKEYTSDFFFIPKKNVPLDHNFQGIFKKKNFYLHKISSKHIRKQRMCKHAAATLFSV